MNAISETCDTCFESTNELQPRPGSTWEVECPFCRMVREKHLHKYHQFNRIEAKLDEILERYEKNE